ncbi:riboflavin kinase [Schaereria dolodes]|nr:riboflavin kinase [Schaereria dolodes]
MRPDKPRDPVAGPDAGPEPPFPLKLNGKVVKGFGRGSKELGIPTANIPIEGLSVGGHEDVESGVYYGWAGLDVDERGKRIEQGAGGLGVGTGVEQEIERGKGENSEGEGGGGSGGGTVWPMVMSIGWNPFYKNTVRSVEVHILHHFPHDFYSAHMNLLILGFIRPEYDYVSKESLIEDIRIDIDVAGRSLQREGYARWMGDGYLRAFGGGDVGM